MAIRRICLPTGSDLSVAAVAAINTLQINFSIAVTIDSPARSGDGWYDAPCQYRRDSQLQQPALSLPLSGTLFRSWRDVNVAVTATFSNE